MHHYNLLIFEGFSPGLTIITNDEFIGQLSEDGNLIYNSWGDFYSTTPPDNLAGKIKEILDQTKHFAGTEIVTPEDFYSGICDPAQGYLIPATDGLKIFFPEYHRDGEDTQLRYYTLAFTFAEDIMSDDKRTSLQQEFKLLSEAKKSPEGEKELNKHISNLERLALQIEARQIALEKALESQEQTFKKSKN